MSIAVLELHDRNIRKSAMLTRDQMADSIALMGVIRVLNDAKIRFVLAGAYGLAGWRQKPRATEDVDVIVAARQVKKAVVVLCEAFPELEPVDLPVVVRLRVRGTSNVRIDIMKPLQQPYLAVFKHTRRVESEGQVYRVPTLEMGLVMKYSAMVSLYRSEEAKHQDAHDFILMAKNNAEKIDEDKLAELGQLLYADGGRDVVEMARKAIRGERLVF